MKALLFPGQGVQKIGMLDEIINSNKEVVDYLSSASKNLDFDLIELISSGPEEKLLRSLAEIDNQRKRFEKDIQEL